MPGTATCPPSSTTHAKNIRRQHTLNKYTPLVEDGDFHTHQNRETTNFLSLGSVTSVDTLLRGSGTPQNSKNCMRSAVSSFEAQAQLPRQFWAHKPRSSGRPPPCKNCDAKARIDTHHATARSKAATESQSSSFLSRECRCTARSRAATKSQGTSFLSPDCSVELMHQMTHAPKTVQAKLNLPMSLPLDCSNDTVCTVHTTQKKCNRSHFSRLLLAICGKTPAAR
jgi:hypothetical protein